VTHDMTIGTYLKLGMAALHFDTRVEPPQAFAQPKTLAAGNVDLARR
jgi:hypothetical protein